MSHFTVMIIGDNPEALLEPYNENTQVEEYEVGGVSEDEMKSFSEFYTKENPDDKGLSFKELYEKYGKDWNGGTWKEVDGAWVEYSTYNPMSKWDWYQLGGRWNGYFKLKNGTSGERGSSFMVPSDDDENYADSCLKGDIDIEGMRKEAEDKALEAYDAVHEALSGIDLSEHLPWEHYLKLRDDGSITIEEARELYHDQPATKAFSKFGMSEEGREYIGFFSKLEDFLISREDYAKQARDSAIASFAVLTEDGWFERGSMGWWGMVADEKDQDRWNKEFAKLFFFFFDDTQINLVDCHI